MQNSADLLLIIDPDSPSLDTLRTTAARFACDRIEAATPAELDAILAVRRPTLAILAIDRPEADGYGALQTLSRHGARPATVLIGAVEPRVLASVRRTAEQRGVPIVGMLSRPIDPLALERLLAPHLSAPQPVLREEILTALAEQEFVLAYQPKIAISGDSLKILGVEAFIRWQHPRRGVLQPRQFLQYVDEFGLVTELTDFVITEAIQQLGIWQRADLSMQMAVNLSPRLVKDREFPDRLVSLIAEHGVEAGQVMLDIGETAGTSDRDLLLDVFTRLRIMGVGLSLDDFGTGLSSLTELYRMPFSEIKIDRTLLNDVPKEHDAEMIVRAMAQLAHSLNIAVCAEGVESREILDFVRAAGFDSAQGRLFCGAVQPAQIERLVRAWPGGDTSLHGIQRMQKPGAEDLTITRRLKRLNLIAAKSA
ncbi:MAG TPA: EAL domain-containing response regulator [Steroidobacteraceae bacterium]|nr:EAL domain-containing response regulator [Steroidobacteraceae bacterium]